MAPGEARVVLVVDDAEDIRVMCRAALEQHGFDVVDAAGGREALDILSTQAPDAVVLDLAMPTTSGWDVLAELSRDGPHPPVIVFTASADEDTEIRARHAGAVAFVAKPVSPQDLVRTIAATLD